MLKVPMQTCKEVPLNKRTSKIRVVRKPEMEYRKYRIENRNFRIEFMKPIMYDGIT
jgi:DNA-dependent RNA polymerase auxiliary subunit epsilon